MCGRGCAEAGILVLLLKTTVWWFFHKVGTELPAWAPVILLGIHPKETKVDRTAICTPTLTAAPFIPSREPGVSGYFWGSQEGSQGPFRPSGRNHPSQQLPCRHSARSPLSYFPRSAGVWAAAPGTQQMLVTLLPRDEHGGSDFCAEALVVYMPSIPTNIW